MPRVQVISRRHVYSLHSNHVVHSIFWNTGSENHPAAAAPVAEISNIKPVQIKHNHSQEVFCGFKIGKAVHKVSSFDPRIRVLLCLCFWGGFLAFFHFNMDFLGGSFFQLSKDVRLTGDHLCPDALATHLGHITSRVVAPLL